MNGRLEAIPTGFFLCRKLERHYGLPFCNLKHWRPVVHSESIWPHLKNEVVWIPVGVSWDGKSVRRK